MALLSTFSNQSWTLGQNDLFTLAMDAGSAIGGAAASAPSELLATEGFVAFWGAIASELKAGRLDLL